MMNRRWEKHRTGLVILSLISILLPAVARGDLVEELEKKAVAAGQMAERYHVREGLLVPTRIEVLEVRVSMTRPARRTSARAAGRGFDGRTLARSAEDLSVATRERNAHLPQ